MGILTNALEQLTGQILGLGFGQLDDYFTRKIQSGRVEEAAREAAETDNEINQRLLMMQNVNQGTFGVPGIGDTTGQMVNPQSPQGQGVLSQLGALPEIPAAITQSPLHASLIEHRGKQFIDQNPIVQQMKQREDIFSEALKRGGQLVGQQALEPGQMESFARDPSQFNLADIRGNLGLREEAIARGKLKVSGPEFDRQQAIRTADRIRAKQSPTYKQMTGGGGGGEGSFNVPQDFLNRVEKEIMRDKSGVYVTVPESQSTFTPEDIRKNPALLLVDERIKEKPALTNRGLRVMQIAEEIAAKSKNRQPLSIINEAKAREKKEFAEQQRATEEIIQGADQAASRVLSAPAPSAPAPQQRAAEVQTGQNPAGQLTAQDRKDIAVMKKPVDQGGLGMTDDEVNAVLRKAGKIK